MSNIKVHGRQPMARWWAGPCHEQHQGAWQATHDKSSIV
jgi:hypothetical protein